MGGAVAVDPIMAGRDPVVQIGLEDALLDQGRAPGGRALVVHVERAQFVREVALVDHGDEGRGHGFADHVRIDAGADAVEVGLHAVADGLVQQHAAGTGGEHDRHLAGRGAAGVEQHQGAPDHLVDLGLEPFVGEKAQVLARPQGAQVALGLVAAPGGHHQV